MSSGPAASDGAGTLRIDEFDIERERYTGRRFIYPLDAQGTNIGDIARAVYT